MLKSSIRLEVETLRSSTKVDMKMRDFGSFSTPSRFPSLRTWVNEGQHSHTQGTKKEMFFLCDLGSS